MSANGALLLVLQSHAPYLHTSKRWPHTELRLHELLVETYLPLLKVLYDLKDDNIPYRLTLALSPILCEQLASEGVLKNLERYLEQRIAAAKHDMRLYAPDNVTPIDELSRDSNEQATSTANGQASDPQLYHLAEWYKGFYEQALSQFTERFNRNLLHAFKQLQDEGLLDILTSAATHAYLPLLPDHAIRAQIETAISSYQQHFGQPPAGIWLPECGYRPDKSNGNVAYSGIEKLLAEYDLNYFFVETHAITGGQPVGVGTGDVIGPYGDVYERYVVPPITTTQPKRTASTFLSYYVSDEGNGSVTNNLHAGVTAFGRHNSIGQQVWSADWGYPGDFDYRELNRKAGTSALRYWRVTGAKVDLAQKDMYHPDWADFKVEQHAEHFSHMVGDQLRDYSHHTQQYGMIAAMFNTDLFGHYWFEGISWLSKVLRHLASREDIDLHTARSFTTEHPAEYTLQLPESSWGAGGTHFIWDNGETHWLWEAIDTSNQRMQQLADTHPEPDEKTTFVLNQAAREALLLQSSDWLFDITTGQARDYAVKRFTEHLERFEHLVASVEAGTPDRTSAEAFYKIASVFPEIDYRCFSTR